MICRTTGYECPGLQTVVDIEYSNAKSTLTRDQAEGVCADENFNHGAAGLEVPFGCGLATRAIMDLATKEAQDA